MDILSKNEKEVTQLVVELGEKAFRGKQIYHWLHQKRVESFADMANIPAVLRQRLDEVAHIATLQQVEVRRSKLDGTTKYLFSCHDGAKIESVWMEYAHGNSVCLSTQSGCKMACTFCASGMHGFQRNLTKGEMLGQIYAMSKDQGKDPTHIVLMGIGEPLDNYENVLDFIMAVTSSEGLGISKRNVTLSTCGLVPQIYLLADEGLPITLAVSLHAPNDQIRRKTMPIARRYPMDELLAACKAYGDKTKRRVTFEYALLKGVNDAEAHAKELATRLKGMLCHVNLIPVNHVEGMGYYPPEKNTINQFASVLQSKHIETTVRRTLGSDIHAACGQLRNQ